MQDSFDMLLRLWFIILLFNFPYVFSTKLQYFNEAEKLISNAFIISKNEYWVPFMQNEGMRYCLTQQEIISQQRKMGKKTGILYS